MFQFYLSSIKRQIKVKLNWDLASFQFYLSSIKRRAVVNIGNLHFRVSILP